jgi:hypothetical protein
VVLLVLPLMLLLVVLPLGNASWCATLGNTAVGKAVLVLLLLVILQCYTGSRYFLYHNTFSPLGLLLFAVSSWDKTTAVVLLLLTLLQCYTVICYFYIMIPFRPRVYCRLCFLSRMRLPHLCYCSWCYCSYATPLGAITVLFCKWVLSYHNTFSPLGLLLFVVSSRDESCSFTAALATAIDLTTLGATIVQYCYLLLFVQ